LLPATASPFKPLTINLSATKSVVVGKSISKLDNPVTVVVELECLTIDGEPVPLNTPSDPIVKAVVSESNLMF
jgi:hypothetical protein